MFVKISAFFGAMGVILGAFGAHYFKNQLGADQLASYKTGVLYLLLHAVILLLLAIFNRDLKNSILKSTWILIALGVTLFSGSIFLLSTQALTGINFSWMGPVTPLGGLLMILGWLNLIRY